MTAIPLQTSVAEKIKALYAISRELEQLFPGRHYTPDGHMIGSIGEALAASWYGLELFEASAKTHDAKAPDGRLVQIKATQISHCGKQQTNGQCPITLATLHKLQAEVPLDKRLPRINEVSAHA